MKKIWATINVMGYLCLMSSDIILILKAKSFGESMFLYTMLPLITIYYVGVFTSDIIFKKKGKG